MALTRPKISQINTKVAALTDSITVLNAGATSANVDSGFLINRAHGLISNAAIYYSETLDTFVTAFTSNSGGIDSNIVISSYVDITTGNVYSTGIHVTGNVDFSLSPNVNLGTVSNLVITGGQSGQILQTLGNGELAWVDNTPSTATYTANSIALTGGVYVSGSVTDIQTFGDYGTGNVYVLTDGSGSAPAWYVDIDFVGVANFNRVVLNINYNQSSGHTIYVQLYNNTTSAWDNIGTYTGLGSYYAFALQVIDDLNYINSGVVNLRLYHSNAGAISHQTSIDYAALELSNQGPQGPRGPTGSTGATGPGVATGGTVGQVLVKNSSTNYDTTWASNLTLANLNLTGTGDISANIGSLYLSGLALDANIGSYQIWANANAAGQYTYITSLDANITAVNVAIAVLQSNAALQANILDILSGNAVTQGSLLEELVANAAVQSANLTYLLSNAAAQESSLTSLVNNAASQSGAIDSINANIGAYQIYANANAATQATSINSLNANIAAANAAIITANTDMKSYVDDQIVLSSGYGNTEVGAYLLTNTGNIAAGNIEVTGNIVGGSIRTTTSATPPVNPVPGDMWYDTTTDVLFRFTDMGTSSYWLDINGQTFSYDLSGNIPMGNIVTNGYYWANGVPLATGLGIDAATTNALTANLGAYQTYANTTINILQANLGAYQIYANANAAAQNTSINSINANLSNTDVNVAVLQSQVYSDANVTSYLAAGITVGDITPLYADVTNIGSPSARFGSLYLAGSTIDLGGATISTAANGTVILSSNLIVSGSFDLGVPLYSNTNVDSYLPVYTGNINAGNIIVNSNVVTSGVKSSAYYFANGTPFASSNYSNTNVAAYLAGNVTSGNVSATGYYWANGTAFSTSTYSNSTVASYLPTYSGNISGSNLSMTGGAVIAGNVEIQGWTISRQTAEVLQLITGATGVVTHNLMNGSTFYHTGIAANITADFTNVPVTGNRVISTTLIVVQGSTPYVPFQIDIEGVPQTIKWILGSTPAGNANKIDVFSFNLMRVSGAWTVLGSSTYFS